MGYTIWRRSMTVGYKTRPPLGNAEGQPEEFTEPRGWWFEPQEVIAGLTQEQAARLLGELQMLAELPGEAFLASAVGFEPKTREHLAARLALGRKEDVELWYFWVEETQTT